MILELMLCTPTPNGSDAYEYQFQVWNAYEFKYRFCFIATVTVHALLWHFCIVCVCVCERERGCTIVFNISIMPPYHGKKVIGIMLLYLFNMSIMPHVMAIKSIARHTRPISSFYFNLVCIYLSCLVQSVFLLGQTYWILHNIYKIHS